MPESQFSRLHVPGKPLVLYNIWDAGSARVIAGKGAQALATGSWSVAAAQGYEDGETLPFDDLLRTVEQIRRVTDLPLSVDFEGGYAKRPADLPRNIKRLLDLGVSGINFEDRIVQGEGLYTIAEQSARIAALRAEADKAGVPLFINARTDLFLREPDSARHADSLEAVIARAAAYGAAGANGFFIPGTIDLSLIKAVCEAVDLPVNVMAVHPDTDLGALAASGVARISFGPFSWRWTMAALETGYERVDL